MEGARMLFKVILACLALPLTRLHGKSVQWIMENGAFTKQDSGTISPFPWRNHFVT